MLSPSDFNNAVPQFTNGNYASNPINPEYIAEPDAESYNRGTEPLQTLPAQWWNWFVNKFTARFNKVNIYVKNIFNELAQILSIFNITPDGTEQTPTTSQLKTVFECCYPQYVKNDLYGNTVGTALGTAAVGTCTTFARSDHVHPLPSYVRDNYNASHNIYFGYCGPGLVCCQINYIAGYSSDIYEPGKIVIKDIARSEMQNWLELGTAAYCPASAFRASDWVPTQVEYSRMTSYLVESASCGTDGNGMYITADSGNELNMHPQNNGTIAWLNYRGGVNTVRIGDGNANSSGYGTAIAACFCGAFVGDLTGTASCATCASCAENACHSFLLDTGVPGWANFRYVAQEGAPEFIWGANDGLNTRVWRPSCLSVLQSGRVSDGTAIGCVECSNEFNIYPAAGNALWLNFRGGAASTCIGNGAGNSGLGDLYASTVHADLIGTATCASALVASDGAEEYFTSLSFSNVAVRQCSSSFTIVQKDSNVVALQCDLWKAFTRVASTGSDMAGPRPISTFGQIRFGTCYATNSYENVQCIYPSGGSWIIKTDVNSYTISQNNTGGFAAINIEGRIADTFPWRP